MGLILSMQFLILYKFIFILKIIKAAYTFVINLASNIEDFGKDVNEFI